MKRITISDIAQLLGVAPSTVSRALADHPDISPATKSRVREVAESLGYIPNFRARYLRAQHSRLVALIVTEMNTFFVPSLVAGVNRVLQRSDYSLLVFQSDDALVQERGLARLCVRLSLDGVLLARSSETTELSHLAALHNAEIPVVLLDKVLETGEHSTVSIDGAQASADAVRYLAEHGHTRIVGVFADERQRISAVRERGFRQAFQSLGLPDEGAVVVHIPYLDVFDERLGQSLAAHPEATAVFTMSDELLVRAYHHLLRTGRRIPGDLSLLSISDGYAPTFLYPGVTHLRHSGAEVGEKAAHILVGLMERSSEAVIDVRIRTELVELDSVRTV